MSIYKKLVAARKEFHGLSLRKTGKNAFAGYAYFELADFLIPGMDCLANAGLVSVISFQAERAVMRIHELDGDGLIEIESPRASANLKGCHPIQNLGAEETYQRRYLWMAALEIVEHDAVDSSKPVERINDGQIADLEALMKEVNADQPKFLQYLKIKDIADLPADSYKLAVSLLEKKRGAA